MEMPEGWKKFQAFNEIDGLKDVDQALNLLKEMAAALYKAQAIAEMTMPNGNIAPKPLYDDITPVLNKWEQWK